MFNMKAGHKAKTKDNQKKPQASRRGVCQAKLKKANAQIRAETSDRSTSPESLLASEVFYRSLFDNVVEGIIVAEVKTARFLHANQAFCSMMGYSYEEISSMGIENIHPSEYLEYARSEFDSLASGHKVHAADVPCLRRDGTILYADISGSAILLDGKKCYVGFFKDVTERKEMETASQESEEKFRDIFNNTNDAIQIVELDENGYPGRFIDVNDISCRMLQYSRDELLQKGPFDLEPLDLEADYLTKPKELIGKEMGTAGSSTFETVHIRKDGSRIPLEVSAHLAILHGKHVSVTVLRDITERKLSEGKLKRQYDRLTALHIIDMAINVSLDIRVTFNVFLEQVISTLNVDAADILLLNLQSYNRLSFVAGLGFRTSALQHTKLLIGAGYAGRVAQERQIIYIPDLRKEGQDLLAQSPELINEGFVTYHGVPLVAKGQLKGVLEIFNRTPMKPDQDWLDFLEALAMQAAIAMDNAILFDDLQKTNIELIQAYDNTLEGWSKALDLRDKETAGHSQSVTEMTLELARQMGMIDSELVHVRRGALLHDIGKMGIPDAILHKSGALSEEEWETMRKHPVYAYELLYPISHLRPALDIPYCHHEKWDGTGYPRGLKGEQIPMAARIFSVVDVWDALRSERPYRPGWPEDKAREHIKEQAGKQFDPKVVEVFLDLLHG
jgi:PAS domain S-box-containing protein/putative nucleotidyltransferase with HDIG domain